MTAISGRWISSLYLLLPITGAAIMGSCGGDASGSPVEVAPAGGSGGDGSGGVGNIGGLTTTGATGGIVAAGGAGPGEEPWPEWLPPAWVSYPNNADGIRSWKDEGVPDTVNQQFGGAEDASLVPEIIYPLDGSMHPRNITDLSVHWRKTDTSSPNTTFRLVISAGGETYHFYTALCSTPGCKSAVPPSEWYWLGQEYAGQSVSIVVQETDGQGGPVHTSAPISVTFSPDPVLGVLYYWAAANWGIYRAQIGARGSVPFISSRSETNDFQCAACHSVSRDGSTIAFAVSEQHGETTAAIQTASTTDPTTPFVAPTLGTTPFTDPAATHDGVVTQGPTDQFGHYVALSPDGTVAAVNGIDPPGVWPMWFELRDARTGASLQKVFAGESPFPANTLPILPEFSPDGARIVATMTDSSVETCAWTYATCSGGIAVLDVAGNTIGAPVPLVNAAPGQFFYYPTWSPDGQYVAFVGELYPGDREGPGSIQPDGLTDKSDIADNGVLFMVPSAGGPHTCPGPNCYELARGGQFSSANAADDTLFWPHTTMPKFAPFAQGPNDNILFIAFTTSIGYGWDGDQGNSQIWMFGVDTNALAPSGDPSYAPIWLPYQDFGDGSLAPFWAEVAPCESDDVGGCSGCVNGEVCRIRADNTCYCIFEGVPR